MIRQKDYSDSTAVTTSEFSEEASFTDRSESTSRICYVCEKIRRTSRKHHEPEVIYVQEKDEMESNRSILFSESQSETGLRYMGIGSAGPIFANGSVILPRDEFVTKMWVAVKDVSPSPTPVNVQFVLTYARANTDNDYSSGVVQTHLSAIVQIPPDDRPQSRAACITVSPAIRLRASDLVGILVNPTDLSVSFQATAGIA